VHLKTTTRNAFVRSSDRANAVNAAAGIRRIDLSVDLRRRAINSKPSISGIPRIVSKCVIDSPFADPRQHHVFFGLPIGGNDHAAFDNARATSRMRSFTLARLRRHREAFLNPRLPERCLAGDGPGRLIAVQINA
jgi:hypothetical protein